MGSAGDGPEEPEPGAGEPVADGRGRAARAVRPWWRAGALTRLTPFARLAIGIGIVSGAVFTWFLTAGRGDLFADRVFSDVFDVQARAIAHGRLDVPADALRFEGFLVDGKTYTYFGIFPSLLRLPVLAVTDRFDGRLTSVSMLAAFAVAFTASALVISRVHGLVAPGRPWTRTGLVVAGLALAAIGLGSNFMFLASAAWVYHEAALWGAAGVLAAFAALLGYLRDPRLGRLLVAAGWTAVAWLSRGSMGLAPSFVLVVVGAAHLFRWRLLGPFVPGRASPRDADVVRPRHPRRAAVALLGALAPMAVFAAVNMAKFDSPTTIPFDRQAINRISAERIAALDAYGGNLFSAGLAPSAAWQMARPDTMGPSAQWPFLDFTYARPVDVGSPVWDTVEPTAGVLTTMPLLLVLGGVAVVAMVRSRGRGPVGALVVLAPFVAGGIVVAAIPLTIAFIAQRYVTDAMPLLVVLAAAGLAVVDRWAAQARPGRRRRVAVVAGTAALAVGGTWVTLSASWLYHHFESPQDARAITDALETQDRVAGALSTPPVPFRHLDALPDDAPRNTLAVVGECDGLYWHNGLDWRVLESTAARGRHRFGLHWGDTSPSGWVTLVRLDPDGEDLVVAVRRRGPDEVEVRITRRGAPPTGRPQGVARAGPDHELVVVADPQVGPVEVVVDGTLVATAYGAQPAGDVVMGPGDGAAGASLSVAVADTPTPLCDRLLAAAR